MSGIPGHAYDDCKKNKGEGCKTQEVEAITEVADAKKRKIYGKIRQPRTTSNVERIDMSHDAPVVFEQNPANDSPKYWEQRTNHY